MEGKGAAAVGRRCLPATMPRRHDSQTDICSPSPMSDTEIALELERLTPSPSFAATISEAFYVSFLMIRVLLWMAFDYLRCNTITAWAKLSPRWMTQRLGREVESIEFDHVSFRCGNIERMSLIL